MTAPALTLDELDDRLDYLLSPVLSSRRTATPLAHALAALDRPLQDFVLHWIEVITRTNYEMAYQFAVAAARTRVGRRNRSARLQPSPVPFP